MRAHFIYVGVILLLIVAFLLSHYKALPFLRRGISSDITANSARDETARVEGNASDNHPSEAEVEQNTSNISPEASNMGPRPSDLLFEFADPPSIAPNTAWRKRYSDVYTAATKGDAKALAIMAYWTRMGAIGGGIVKAEEFANKSAESGNPFGQFELAKIYTVTKRGNAGALFASCFQPLLTLAEKGDPDAEMRVGNAYYFGLGTIASTSSGHAYIWSAIDKKHIDAMYMYAVMNENGVGFEKGREYAYDAYCATANMGFGLSSYTLATITGNGHGINLPPDEALAWLKQAADIGYYKAFGMMGYKATKDPQEAVKWYIKGVERKDPFSIYELAECYDEGKGVETDKSQAADLYKRFLLMGCDDNPTQTARAKGHLADYAREQSEKDRIAQQELKQSSMATTVINRLNELGVKTDSSGNHYVDYLSLRGLVTDSLQRFYYDPKNPTKNRLICFPIDESNDPLNIDPRGEIVISENLRLNDVLLRWTDEGYIQGQPSGSNGRKSIKVALIARIHANYPQFKKWEQKARDNSVNNFIKNFDGTDADYNSVYNQMVDKIRNGQSGPNVETERCVFEWADGAAILGIVNTSGYATRMLGPEVEFMNSLFDEMASVKGTIAQLMQDRHQKKKQGKAKIDNLFQ